MGNIKNTGSKKKLEDIGARENTENKGCREKLGEIGRLQEIETRRIETRRNRE